MGIALESGSLTQIHVCSFGTVGAWDILEDGIQDLLLDLSDGVTVEDLHWDLWAVHIVWTDTAQDLRVAGRGRVKQDNRKDSQIQKVP